jgi:hypothetical protein
MARSKRSQLSSSIRRAVDARDYVARQDMAFGLCALVRPAIRLGAGRRRAFVEGRPQRWQGGEVIVQGPEIDSDDLGVLLACAAIALERFDHPSTRLDAGKRSTGLVAPSRPGVANLAEDLDACTVATSFAEVCRLLGRSPDDGRAHAAIRASLARLASIVLIARQGHEEAFTHLLASGESTGRNRLTVTLSFRLTGTLVGARSYGRIRMDAWQRLKPVARVLYHWLACWRPGHGRCPPIGLDTLAAHVWGPDDATPNLARRHRQQLRAALGELPADEWRVHIDGQLVHIQRLARAADSPVPAGEGQELVPSKPPVLAGDSVSLSTQTRVPQYAATSEGSAHTRLPHQWGSQDLGS